MILKRKAYKELLEWKKRQKLSKSAILLDGARRVGKSFLAELFGSNEYKSYILVNFAKLDKEEKKFFEEDLYDFDLFFSELSIKHHTKLYEHNSLIILDEIQLMPKVREAIKFLVEDGRYDYIETGSLISIKANIKNIVIPSEEEHLYLKPLDFEEFLWALNDEMTVPFLKDSFNSLKEVGQVIHKETMKKFREYMLVGGMPQSVVKYVETKSFEASDNEKQRILTLYRDDITRFASRYKSKVLEIFDNIPSQLTKKEKKFNVNSISQTLRIKDYNDSFLWLKEGRIINTCYNSTDPSVGLMKSFDTATMKCYFADTGLLVTHSYSDKSYMDNELYEAVLMRKLSVNEGMLTENIVAQMLKATNHKLFFYSRNDTNDRAKRLEVDFLIQRDNKISPVEVKSSAYTTHSSLDKFKKMFGKHIGNEYILYTKDVLLKDGIIHLPLYMTMFL